VIPAEVLSRLRCPDCGGAVTDREGQLLCPIGHGLPWTDGYVDALRSPDDEATRATAESFGYEWTTFATIEPEDREFWEVYAQDVPAESLRGAVALDAGCGKGRYTYFLASQARAVAAVESSDAVRAAVGNLGSLPNVAVIRADLRVAPFSDRSFDFVSCLGVLHHLAAPEEGFRTLARLLAPGGRMLMYLYSRPERLSLRSVGLAAATGLRRLTVRLPHPLLRRLSFPVAALLYAGLVVPGAVGARLGAPPLSRLPLSAYRGKPFRSLWLDTFDRLSAPIEHRYVWTDVEPWFGAAGLRVERVRDEAGLFVVARKPAEVLGT
jgi:SAM-dependent methyltransferase